MAPHRSNGEERLHSKSYKDDDAYPADFRTGNRHYADAENSPSASEDEEAEQPCIGWRSLIVCIGLILLVLACWLGVMSHSGGGSPAPSPPKVHPIPTATTLRAVVPIPITTPAPGPSPPNLHDGNICMDSEEYHAGLCYKKCSLLTDNSNTIRTSPWTCCENKPCFVNQRLHIGLKIACVGYAVSGEGKCPHLPGACLDNEETMLGVCYKKCSLLTNTNYPYRVGPATCCKKGGLSCLYFWKTYTSKEFNVGGGRKGVGACLQEEEMLLGTCYKKCSLLTDDTHPHRLGPFTCCGARRKFPHIEGGVWHLGCLDLRKMKSMPNFAAKGNRTEVEYGSPHFPLPHLTEVQANSSNDKVVQV